MKPEIQVLYVEDSPAYARLVRHALAGRPDVRLVVATGGLGGLELARRDPPTLILLDRHLPDLDGDEVLARLRSWPEMSTVPVVMITADDAAADVDRLLAAGASGCLTKPIEPAALLDLVDGRLPQVHRPTRDAGAERGATHPAGEELVDDQVLAGLRRLVAVSPDGDLDGLLGAFTRETRSRIAQLHRAVAAGDVAGVATVAHTIIGSSASFGAIRIAQGARDLQALANEGDLAAAGAVVERLEADLVRTTAALGIR
ncbi:MAG TPA: response regulator [Gemmatimonadales bacterium]|nr:response regulator [Gemmatimonadales bacterium]